MSQSIKDALLKAGVISKESIRRDEIEEKGADQKGMHEHHMNTFCSQCNKTSEDVEYYEHTNRNLKSKWLCVSCADKNWIHDDCRTTQQSVLSRGNRFQRFYGPTKRFTSATGTGSNHKGGTGQKFAGPVNGNVGSRTSQAPHQNNTQQRMDRNQGRGQGDNRPPSGNTGTTGNSGNYGNSGRPSTSTPFKKK